MRISQAAVSASQKLALGMAPLVGEGIWHMHGDPARTSIEPLQHLGNVGPGFAYVVMTAAIADNVIDYAAARQAPIDHGVSGEFLDSGEERRRITYRMAGVYAVGSQVYAETLVGTRDPIDLLYGLGAVALGFILYRRLRQKDSEELEMSRPVLPAS